LTAATLLRVNALTADTSVGEKSIKKLIFSQQKKFEMHQ